MSRIAIAADVFSRYLAASNLGIYLETLVVAVVRLPLDKDNDIDVFHFLLALQNF